MFALDGGLIAHWGRDYPTLRPGPGRVEQDPQHWLDGVRDAIDAVLVGQDPQAVAGIGLSSQVNTEVFVDASGVPLMPAITWQDVRAATQAQRLLALAPAAQRALWWQGVEMPIGASHVLAKILWMQDHHPEIWARTDQVLSPKDYCLFKMAGVRISDPISAFGQVGDDQRYIAPLLALVPEAMARLPVLHPITAPVGEMALGSHPRRVPVVAGTMDALSNLIGCGVHSPGEGMYISGTSEILALTGAQRIGAPGVVTFPTVEGLVVNAGPTQSGGDSLRWWSRIANTDSAGVVALAEQADRDARPILFLPHLEGERAPIWDSGIRGSFIGLDSRSGGPEYALAVMEGVALSARHLFGALVQSAGGRPARMLYGGGGARSDLWSQIRADCLGVELHRFDFADVGCLGAAILAAIGTGSFRDIRTAVPAMTRVERVFTPDPRRMPRYDRMFDAYLKAIDALRPLGIIDPA